MVGRGRAPCCDKSKVKSGAWSPEEDFRLVSFIHTHGHPNWRALPSQAGLLRCGKSCRLRWINYLRPNVKRGNLTQQEEEIVINLHQSLGNKWSKIAASLPGRTDNEIKNIWNTHLKKKVMMYGHDQYSSSSNSNDQVIEPAKQAASLSHSCSFSSSNSSNDIVGQKGGSSSGEEFIDHDHDHDQFKEWLRCLENELGLSEEEEKTLTLLSHVDDDDLDHRGLVQVQVQDQDMNQIIIHDEDIIIDQNLINVSISSWQLLFSSLPHL